jgi:hypothetical protein
LGVEHILTGVDHLLFVLALIIITRGGWKLVKTVTAFTLSHSITLTAATLGFVHVPQRPVEAVIALSIVFVATEILRMRRRIESITISSPWMVAFSFGLIHGLGFAGGLSDAGLPVAHIQRHCRSQPGRESGHFLFIDVLDSREPRPHFISALDSFHPAMGVLGHPTHRLLNRLANEAQDKRYPDNPSSKRHR